MRIDRHVLKFVSDGCHVWSCLVLSCLPGACLLTWSRGLAFTSYRWARRTPTDTRNHNTVNSVLSCPHWPFQRRVCVIASQEHPEPWPARKAKRAPIRIDLPFLL